MPLFLYNTLTRRKEEFIPLNPEHVGMYVCGPTVYDRIHVGNARPEVVFDVLNRLLRRLYPKVTFVRNITDVDDKINARAKERGQDIRSFTEVTAENFHKDVAALNTILPDVEPRVTTHIDAIQRIIQALIDKGHAYEAEGHVLFNIPSMEDYGKLSQRPMDDMIAGARVDVAPYKRHPGDFVLWKPSSPDLPGWDSPWGRGRPGWHIECSAMASQHLGETFDIHGGGQDLIFPHHENEVAQSECAHGKPLARYWLHNGMLNLGGEKMSKSVGNFFTLRDVLAQYPGEVVRLALLSGHYHQPLEWTEDLLRQSKTNLDRFYIALRHVADVEAVGRNEVPIEILAALEDDLNTPLAIAHLHELATELNKAGRAEAKARAKGRLLASGDLMGLFQQDPEVWFRWQPEGAATLDEAEIERLIAARVEAKKAKSFAEADRIRDELMHMGIVLEDSPQGTTWRRA